MQSSESLDSEQLQAQFRESIDLLTAAIRLDPAYPDPKCFLGIVNLRFLEQPELAEPWIDECLGSNPPADVRALVEPLQAEIDQALAD